MLSDQPPPRAVSFTLITRSGLNVRIGLLVCYDMCFAEPGNSLAPAPMPTTSSSSLMSSSSSLSPSSSRQHQRQRRFRGRRRRRHRRRRRRVHAVAVSSWWGNGPPLAVAPMYQQAFARRHNVAVLAANGGVFPTSGGSGICR
jgi:predicted amidohydrolase